MPPSTITSQATRAEHPLWYVVKIDSDLCPQGYETGVSRMQLCLFYFLGVLCRLVLKLVKGIFLVKPLSIVDARTVLRGL